MKSPVAAAIPVWSAAPFPPFGCRRSRSRSGHLAASRSSTSPVPSVEPSSTTTSSISSIPGTVTATTRSRQASTRYRSL